jgi:hypothetical protein
MKIIAISTVIAALASAVSAAPESAQPKPDKQEAQERVSYTERESDEPAAKSAWIELASPTPAKHGREFVMIDESTGPLTHLRIDVDRGRPLVRSVRIHYSDGKQRVVRIDRVLGGKTHTSALVDLRGARVVDHIVVITDRTSKGTYTVHGAPRQTAESIATR